MIVGIDVGTQSLKAVVLTTDLEVRGTGQVSYAHRAPAPGHAEQDPAVWLAALAPAIAAGLSAARARPADVSSIGVTGQLDGCVAVDSSGTALGPALIWMDKRASLPDIDRAALLERTGQVADPSHMAAKIAWLKAEGSKASCFHQPVSFVVAALCGERVFDHAHASTTMLFDQDRGDFADDLLAAFGISRSELPRIDSAMAVAGTLTDGGAALSGLPPGTSVCVGTGDDFSTPLGAGIAAPGPVACVLGTAEVVGAVSLERVLDRDSLVETHTFFEERYFIENPGWLAGGAIAWAQRVFGFATAAELDREARESEPGARGVSFLPALAGAMAPRWLPDARACFDGVSASHERADFARAILEGCAFAMTDVTSRLIELGLELDHIALLGGGSRSELWAQIRADASGLPVAIAQQTETAAIGAAVLAAVAIGAQPSIDSAAQAVAEFGEPRQPRVDLSGGYARYRELFDRLYSR